MTHFEEWEAKQMEDPEFRKAADELEADYELERERILDELDDQRVGRVAEYVLRMYKRNPSSFRSYAEFRAELVREGLLDEICDDNTPYTYAVKGEVG